MSLSGMRPMVICLFACGMLTVFAGGCAGGKPVVVTDSNFDQTVLAAREPVMVDFYKQGCPPCILLDSVFDTLADEYKGKAIIAKMEVSNVLYIPTAPRTMGQYGIALTPTVILFNNGTEVRRWVSNSFPADEYRRALDEALRGNIAATPR